MIVTSILAFLAVFAQQPPVAPAVETLRTRVEHIHDVPGVSVRGARLQRADSVVHFFEKRSFAPAWTLPAGAGQVREAILGIERDGLTPAHYHLAAIDALLAARPTAPNRALDDDLQILLTDAVATLLDHVRYGKVNPSSLDRRWNIDPRAGAVPLESLVEQVASAASLVAAIESLKPNHFIYTGLRDALARLRAVVAGGGWPAVPAGPTLKPGVSDTRVIAVRQRLAATGLLPPDIPTGCAEYDDTLVAVVKQYQEANRLTPDGAIGPATLQALNTGAAARVEQIRVNLERIRWVIGGLDDSFVLVNLPSYKLYVIRDRQMVWETRTQIGREVRQTPTFRAEMRYLVFNPDWTVPPTILAQDVLAGMRKGQNTIARKGLTIIDRQGRRVDPSTIDWSSATPRNFPYVLRQPPGPGNALGRVKFVFPNEHTVFLHDTPSQELFGHDKRTFSSGCIRVEHALDLAAVLLQSQNGWTPERIGSVVDDGKTQTVFLERPLPVMIVYWTASVGTSGQLRFARDVYNRDPTLLRALEK
jgi:L,D-transpeptidase YcbB